MTIERELLKRIAKYRDTIPPEFIYEICELLAQPEQTEQEPVAWKVIDGTNGKYMFSRIKPTERSYKYDVVIPLYTAPPKREPLSESEIASIWGDSDYDVTVVRRIEKAHGIGGEE